MDKTTRILLERARALLASHPDDARLAAAIVAVETAPDDVALVPLLDALRDEIRFSAVSK